MREPVAMKDGHSYEKEAITKWLRVNTQSPFNARLKLDMKDAVVNYALKGAMEEWLEGFSFSVVVKSKTGRTIPVILKLTDTVMDLKEKVSAQTTECPGEMRFFYGAVCLSDEQTVEDCDFQSGAVIYEPFQVICESVEGRKLMIDGVRLDDSVDSLMEKICARTGSHIDNLYLTYETHPLERGKTLGEYGVHKDSRILELFRLRGGSRA
jgi:hypothetical protein